MARKNSSSQQIRKLRTFLLENMLEPEAIGGRIKLARERAGLRQEDLAHLINLSTRQVQHLEAGDSKPYIHLDAIGRATQVTVEWLLHGDPLGEEPPATEQLGQVEERLQRLERGQEAEQEMLRELLRLLRDGRRDIQSDPG